MLSKCRILRRKIERVYKRSSHFLTPPLSNPFSRGRGLCSSLREACRCISTVDTFGVCQACQNTLRLCLASVMSFFLTLFWNASTLCPGSRRWSGQPCPALLDEAEKATGIPPHPAIMAYCPRSRGWQRLLRLQLRVRTPRAGTGRSVTVAARGRSCNLSEPLVTDGDEVSWERMGVEVRGCLSPCPSSPPPATPWHWADH